MIINPYRHQVTAAQNIFQILTTLGYTTNLQFALDAGEGSSYTSGQKFLDLSGNGQDFLLGADGSATATDPTFNGVADTLSSAEFFSFDGGDRFTYDTTNEAWMQTLHKDNAAYSAVVWVYPAAFTTTQSLLATCNTIATGPGILLEIDTSGTPLIRASDGSSAAMSNSFGATTSGAWNFIGISVDEAVGAGGVKWRINGSVGTDTSTYTSPSSSSAATTMTIGAGGAGATPILSGGRVAIVCAWSRALSAAELGNIYAATRQRFYPNGSMIQVLTDLGLTTNLQLCLDAGDSQSYQASVQSIRWLDRSGNGYDFFRGADGSATATDPTHNGVAGALSSAEYFSFDAGDYLTYDTTNEAWMETLHKDNAVGTFLAWYYPAGAANNLLFGTSGNDVSSIGVAFLANSASGFIRLNVNNGTGTISKQINLGAASVGVVDGAWQMLGVSWDEAADSAFTFRNATVQTHTAAYSSPSASSATYTAQIAAAGNAVTPVPTGARMAAFCAWSTPLTQAQIQAIFAATRGRFGV